jgi:hypothetical protein
MGDAGLLLPAEADTTLVAEALAEVIGDEKLRGDLIDRGRRRLRDCDAEQAQATFLSHLASVA